MSNTQGAILTSNQILILAHNTTLCPIKILHSPNISCSSSFSQSKRGELFIQFSMIVARPIAFWFQMARGLLFSRCKHLCGLKAIPFLFGASGLLHPFTGVWGLQFEKKPNFTRLNLIQQQW
jgi:hypothetical protein